MFNPFKKSPKAAPSRVRPERPAMPKSGEPVPTPRAVLPAKERRLVGYLTVPHQTEKASAAQAGGWYTFQVRPDATKGGVRQAVEERYGVSVTRVRMLAARPRAVRLGRILGETPGFKKAMVKIAAGQSISFA